MDLDDIATFLAVAQRCNFATVAKERGVDPSSISRVIADLERELGVRLFQRTTRRLSLTEAGDLYLAHVEPLLHEFERARDAATSTTGRPRGLLRLTASETFGHFRIVPLLTEFRERYPDLKLECRFTDANLDLVAERIDLAIRLGPSVEGNLIASKLIDTFYRVVASPGYLSHAAKLSIPRDLQLHKVLMFNLRAFRTRWIFRDAQDAETEVAIDGDVTLSPASALRTAALAGLGPALLPSWLVDQDIQTGMLINCFPSYRVTATTFSTAAWLVYPSRSFLPNKVRVMIDFLREKIGQQKPGSHDLEKRVKKKDG
jgi:DNA-binding transcriptional LysR family regulator